ncbi:MAG: FG-GAP-like repeat-containing protein, partial [Saprospiraceae bacterium]
MRTKPYLSTYFLFYFHLFFIHVYGQNTIYTSGLYTNSTFVKTINTTLQVGTIGGSADVSNGSASYNIPIAVPPGTNGVAPSLSISYNSNGGNGHLGRGWDISGMSMISRSSKSIYFDGEVNSIDLSANDRFAIDGSRLIVKSGIYGAPSSTDGTEVENFALTTSYNGTTGNPDYWEIFTKDGVKMEFGNSSDSKFYNSTNTKILFWRLNKIKYNDGNYIEYKYNNSDGDSRIDEINYTGNSAANLVPYNKVKFAYSIRFDINNTYLVGTNLTSKYLLDEIKVTAEGAVLCKKFTLKYGKNDVNSFLQEITESGADGTSLNSTIFKYGEQPIPFDNQVLSKFGSIGDDIFPGDFNGDGFSDILFCPRIQENGIYYNTSMNILKKDPNPNNVKFTQTATQILPPSYSIINKKGYPNSYNFMTNDFTGDGVDDVFLVKRGLGAKGKIELSEAILYKTKVDASGFENPTSISIGATEKKIYDTNKDHVIPGDFNGDGRSDILIIIGDGTNFQPLLFLGGTLTFNSLVANGTLNIGLSSWVYADKISILDFNGDGKSDIMVTKETNSEIFTFDGYSVRSIYYSGFPTKWHIFLQFGDFNGDGKTDFLCFNNGIWYKNISTGKEFISSNFTFNKMPSGDINNDAYADKILISDFNGDGKMDINHVFQQNFATFFDLYSSLGNEFIRKQYSYPLNPSIGQTPYLIDVNGDGRTDILHNNNFGENYTNLLQFNKLGTELLLEKVKNGVDYTTSFLYSNMTFGPTYNQVAITDHPFNTIKAPLFLVSELSNQNGIGGNSIMQFTYEEAKLHKEGKGLLGFKKITSKNLVSGFHSVAEFDFNTQFYAPFLKKSSTFLSSNNSLMNEVTNITDFIDLGKKQYWPRLYQTTNNKAFENQKIISSNSYDIYGNVTQNISSIYEGNSTIPLEITSTTVNQFYQFGTSVPSKPETVSILKKRAGQADYTSKTNFGYDGIGRVVMRIDFFLSIKSQTTQFDYQNSPLGNLKSSAVSALGITSRLTSFTYDSKGRFVTSTTDPLLQTSSSLYDNKWGKPISSTGMDGLTTAFTYDGFGRVIIINPPAATSYAITNTFGWAINSAEKTIH